MGTVKTALKVRTKRLANGRFCRTSASALRRRLRSQGCWSVRRTAVQLRVNRLPVSCFSHSWLRQPGVPTIQFGIVINASGCRSSYARAIRATRLRAQKPPSAERRPAAMRLPRGRHIPQVQDVLCLCELKIINQQTVPPQRRSPYTRSIWHYVRFRDFRHEPLQVAHERTPCSTTEIRQSHSATVLPPVFGPLITSTRSSPPRDTVIGTMARLSLRSLSSRTGWRAPSRRNSFVAENSGIAVWGSDCWNTRLPAHRRLVSRPWSVSSSDITSRA